MGTKLYWYSTEYVKIRPSMGTKTRPLRQMKMNCRRGRKNPSPRKHRTETIRSNAKTCIRRYCRYPGDATTLNFYGLLFTVFGNNMEMNTPMRSPQQARDDCADRRRESGSFSARGGTYALLPTPRRIPFAPPEVAAATILNSLNKGVVAIAKCAESLESPLFWELS